MPWEADSYMHMQIKHTTGKKVCRSQVCDTVLHDSIASHKQKILISKIQHYNYKQKLVPDVIQYSHVLVSVKTGMVTNL